MADTSAPVNSAATAGDNATTKNPFADTQNSNSSESAALGVSKPLTVTPDVHKPASTPTATANGGALAPSISSAASAAPAASASNGDGVNGSGTQFESLVPEETKQPSVPASDPAPPAATEAPTSSIFGGSAPDSASTSAQPPVMTGALPHANQSNSTASESKSAESTTKDSVEDITGASAVPKPTGPTQTDDIKGASVGSTTTSDGPAPSAPADSSSAPKPSVLNGAESKDGGIDTTTGTVLDEKKDAASSTALPATEESSTSAPIAVPVEKKDVEMKDAAPIPLPEKPSAPAPTPVLATAPVTDMSGVVSTTGAPTTTPALATPATAAAEATGEKRKATADDDEAATEPAAKKQKGAFSRAIEKAKETVRDVKEKASKPGRKPGKREKKAVAPVGRTERKTRSQARAE